jgi:hypothetical protein
MADEPSSDDAAGYRPVSGLAVAALLAGCGSALVLFTSLAAVVPLVAIVMAVAALAELRRSEGRRVGRVAALAGLALAIGFTTQALAGAAVDRWIAVKRATATADAWIEAVCKEDFAAAIGLCSGSALPATDRGDPFEPPASKAERLTAFRGLPAVAAVAACGGTRPAVVVERDPAGGSSWMARADLAGCGAAGTSLVLRVEPRGAVRGRTPIDRWLVTSLELDR